MGRHLGREVVASVRSCGRVNSCGSVAECHRRFFEMIAGNPRNRSIAGVSCCRTNTVRFGKGGCPRLPSCNSKHRKPVGNWEMSGLGRYLSRILPPSRRVIWLWASLTLARGGGIDLSNKQEATRFSWTFFLESPGHLVSAKGVEGD